MISPKNGVAVYILCMIIDGNPLSALENRMHSSMVGWVGHEKATWS